MGRTMRAQRGIVLVLVLLLVALLVVVVGQLCYTTAVDRSMAEGTLEEAQVALAMASGIEHARALLEADAGSERGWDAPGEPWSRPFRRTVGVVVVDGAMSDAEARWHLYWLAAPAPAGRDVAAELGRALAEHDGRPDGATVARSLVAWFAGAPPFPEAATRELEGRAPPAAPLVSMSELAMLEGVEAGAVHGAGSGERSATLDRVLTIWGSGRINLNSASAPVLASLDERLAGSLARSIVDRREEASDGSVARPYESVEALAEVPGMNDPIGEAPAGGKAPTLYGLVKDRVTVTSTAFTLELVARGPRLERRARVVLVRDRGTVTVASYE